MTSKYMYNGNQNTTAMVPFLFKTKCVHSSSDRKYQHTFTKVKMKCNKPICKMKIKYSRNQTIAHITLDSLLHGGTCTWTSNVLQRQSRTRSRNEATILHFKAYLTTFSSIGFNCSCCSCNKLYSSAVVERHMSNWVSCDKKIMLRPDDNVVLRPHGETIRDICSRLLPQR